MNRKLQYCDKKMGNNSRCSSLATNICELEFTDKKKTSYRCDIHKVTGTVHGTINKETTKPFKQQQAIDEVNSFLKSLIGVKFYSKIHRCEIEGKYIKDNGGLMCISNFGKWKFVYHHQIDLNYQRPTKK